VDYGFINCCRFEYKSDLNRVYQALLLKGNQIDLHKGFIAGKLFENALFRMRQQSMNILNLFHGYASDMICKKMQHMYTHLDISQSI
jgi:hypothetical protein